jgi:AGCS family alanine or glycine:cation symporter
VLAVAVILFAFSTMISWSYYGMKATGYLFGDNQTAENVYKVVFCIFTVLGSVTALDAVLGFSDAAIFLMSVPNVIGLYILARVLRKEISQYRAKIANGEIQRVK